MEVCNLNECDFLETRFIEYESVEEFNNDGTFNTTTDGKAKGIMLQFMNNGSPIYKYSPWGCNESEYKQWEQDTMKNTENENCHWLQNLYWKLDQVSVVLVVRNKLWFEYATPVLQKVWNTIVTERKNGYQHRAPKKRTTRNEKNDSAKDNMKCLIDLSGMKLDDINIDVPEPKPIDPDKKNVIISIDTDTTTTI